MTHAKISKGLNSADGSTVANTAHERISSTATMVEGWTLDQPDARSTLVTAREELRSTDYLLRLAEQKNREATEPTIPSGNRPSERNYNFFVAIGRWAADCSTLEFLCKDCVPLCTQRNPEFNEHSDFQSRMARAGIILRALEDAGYLESHKARVVVDGEPKGQWVNHFSFTELGANVLQQAGVNLSISNNLRTLERAETGTGS